jgi:hypothetical protein
MAKAYERASKRVDAVSEALLAELIQRDVQQLTEDALGGLVACLHSPGRYVQFADSMPATAKNV